MLSGMLAAEHVAEALAEGRANDELASYDEAWREGDIGRDLWKVRNAKPLWSKLGTFLGIAAGGLDMWTQHARLLAVRHARPRQARRRDAQAGRSSAGRSPIRSRTASSPSTGCPRCFCPTPITRRTSRSHLHVGDMALQKASEHDVYAGPSARYCPAGVYEWVRGGRPAALRDQRAELRPLQNLRHQGPEPQHHLGAAGGRRRAEILEHVSAVPRLGHDTATPRVRMVGTAQRRGIPLLAGGPQKGHSAPELEGLAHRRPWRQPLVIVPTPFRRLAGVVLGAATLLCRPRLSAQGAAQTRRSPAIAVRA